MTARGAARMVLVAAAAALLCAARGRERPVGPTMRALATPARQAATINFSENPVRGASVTINYTGTPRTVAIYAFTGARVRGIASPPSGSVVWDLTADDGRPVVNGVYIVAVDLGGSVVRRRLYVARKGP